MKTPFSIYQAPPVDTHVLQQYPETLRLAQICILSGDMGEIYHQPEDAKIFADIYWATAFLAHKKPNLCGDSLSVKPRHLFTDLTPEEWVVKHNLQFPHAFLEKTRFPLEVSFEQLKRQTLKAAQYMSTIESNGPYNLHEYPAFQRFAEYQLKTGIPVSKNTQSHILKTTIAIAALNHSDKISNFDVNQALTFHIMPADGLPV